MHRYLPAICSGYNLTVSVTFICNDRLKSKMAAFLACFKIHRFHAISFPKALPSKTVSSRSNIPLFHTEAERRRREAGVIHSIWIENAGHVYMFVCLYACMYVFQGFLETESTYRSENGTIW